MNERLSDALPRWIALASQYLGWAPETIWQATPAEISMALGHPDATRERPLTRSEFEQLIESEGNGRSN